LSNVNSENDVALQIMLVGQPELRRKLERPQLKQFAQRVAVDFHLNALSRTDAHAYVRHRLRVAGGSDAIFHRKAIDAIHKLSGGIPRLINQLCDLCLVYAFADGRPWVAASTVAQVMRDRGDRTKAGLFAGGVEIAPLTAVPTADASEDSACNAHTGP
jgi:type II secretory pathway predicted ATPase ExeA